MEVYMKKSITLAIALLAPALASAEIESVYTDSEAAAKAKGLFQAAKDLRNQVTELCVARAVPKLHQAAKQAGAAIEQWPDDHLKYRALFPYGDCRQAMVDVQAYATTCAVGGYKGEAAMYDQMRWQDDIAACEAAIAKPDLSLKDF